MKTALVIGGGPAGLMAADVLAQAGVAVTIADAMPSLGRKFLMAGKSGLNLTKIEADFAATYPDLHPTLKKALDEFGPADVRKWAQDLGQEVFVGSTGRLFPTAMKASPLLRAWMGRINAQVLTRHRWAGWDGAAALFDTADGPKSIAADAYVLACGGASWSRLGSDGKWADHFKGKITSFGPSNVGLTVAWSDHMKAHFGKPLKAVAFHAGQHVSRGEVVVSRQGLEGGGIYALSPALREAADLSVDLLPDWSIEKVRTALQRPRGKQSMANHLRKVLKMDPLRLALLMEFGRPFPDDLAGLVKALPVRHAGLRPIDEAISTSGGLSLAALTDGLMVQNRDGVFCAGEMLDWDAPTGGYLLTACLATGRLAGISAAAFLVGDLGSDSP